MVNSKGKLLKLALTLTRLFVQSSPQLLVKLSSQLSDARCTGKQVLRYSILLCGGQELIRLGMELSFAKLKSTSCFNLDDVI